MYPHQSFGVLPLYKMFSPSTNDENEAGFNGRTPGGFDHIMEEGGRDDMGMRTWINAPVTTRQDIDRFQQPSDYIDEWISKIRCQPHSTPLVLHRWGRTFPISLSCRGRNSISVVFVIQTIAIMMETNLFLIPSTACSSAIPLLCRICRDE